MDPENKGYDPKLEVKQLALTSVHICYLADRII
jgi:hypothetical protein